MMIIIELYILLPAFLAIQSPQGTQPLYTGARYQFSHEMDYHYHDEYNSYFSPPPFFQDHPWPDDCGVLVTCKWREKGDSCK